MDVSKLIEDAQKAGVKFEIIDGELSIGTVPSNKSWLKKLLPHRPAIMAVLQGEETGPPPFPEIEPFDPSTLPAFPTHVLPDCLRQWVAAEAEATQTPPDLAGLLALAVCSAAVAGKIDVQPRPGWREPVNLFVAVALEPGNRKSAVFTDAVAPLRAIETELAEAQGPEVARLLSERRQVDARLKRLEKIAAEQGDAQSRREAGDLAVELAAMPEAAMPRLLVDDATAEKVAVMLAEQGGRLASMSPEGGVFDLMAGLYSRNGTPQFGVYLQGHSGDDLVVDRIGRPSVRVKRPALTCAYAVQPAVLRGLCENAIFRGRGLLGRFLYAVPASPVGSRRISPAPVPEVLHRQYELLIRWLHGQDGGELHLDMAATGARVAWESEIEAMLADGGDMEAIRDWGSKLAGETLRIAAVLHLVGNTATVPVGSDTFMAAVEIGRYLIPHAEHALTLLTAKAGTSDAEYLLKWIERNGLPEFTKTLAHHQCKRRFRLVEDIEPALAELVRRGFIRLMPTPKEGPGRPPSPTFEVNPEILKDARNRSQYSHKPIESPNSGNIGSASEHVEIHGDGEDEVNGLLTEAAEADLEVAR